MPVPGHTAEGASRSVYAHLPFCEAKCHYCDFFSLPEGRVEGDRQARVYRAIINELAGQSAGLSQAPATVFLGGGTPSLAPAEVLEKLLSLLAVTSKLDRWTNEITMEVNPSSVTAEKANGWRALGVNRISMGVQAWNDERLVWLGRVHTRSRALAALEQIAAASFQSVSIDYIVGVPGQSRALIKSELTWLLETFPFIDHVSAYLLTLKNSNPKARELPAEEEQLDHLRAVSQTLCELGFEHYEISNFARPGARARHNENYWLGGSYLGVGPSAHSFERGRSLRTKNWGSLERYTELQESGVRPIEWEEVLDEEQRRLEFLMLRLRRADGLDLEQYRTIFGRDLIQTHGDLLRAWEKQGLCRLGSELQLTAEGFFLSDQILSRLTR